MRSIENVQRARGSRTRVGAKVAKQAGEVVVVHAAARREQDADAVNVLLARAATAGEGAVKVRVRPGRARRGRARRRTFSRANWRSMRLNEATPCSVRRRASSAVSAARKAVVKGSDGFGAACTDAARIERQAPIWRWTASPV